MKGRTEDHRENLHPESGTTLLKHDDEISPDSDSKLKDDLEVPHLWAEYSNWKPGWLPK